MGGTPEISREPCPDRILDDTGGAFAMGSIGGSVFHFLKGIYNSPNGERFIGGSQTVRMNAPRLGGSFAVWGGLFSTFDCTLVYVRQKEDPWNSIMAGATTGGFLQMRQGLARASRAALFGGCFLALVEGAGIMMNKLVSDIPPNIELSMEEASGPISMGQFQEEEQEDSSSSWFGGLFGGGGGGEKKTSGGGGSKAEILESFDTPSAPIPSFEYE